MGVGALIVVTILAIVVAGEPEPYDPTSPEGVVQMFVNAVLAGDDDGAEALMTADAQEHCTAVLGSTSEEYAVSLLDTSVTDDNATVRVLITTRYSAGGLFGPSEYQQEDSFGLDRTPGGWRVDRMPWQFGSCTR